MYMLALLRVVWHCSHCILLLQYTKKTGQWGLMVSQFYWQDSSDKSEKKTSTIALFRQATTCSYYQPCSSLLFSLARYQKNSEQLGEIKNCIRNSCIYFLRLRFGLLLFGVVFYFLWLEEGRAIWYIVEGDSCVQYRSKYKCVFFFLGGGLFIFFCFCRVIKTFSEVGKKEKWRQRRSFSTI